MYTTDRHSAHIWARKYVLFTFQESIPVTFQIPIGIPPSDPMVIVQLRTGGWIVNEDIVLCLLTTGVPWLFPSLPNIKHETLTMFCK